LIDGHKAREPLEAAQRDRPSAQAPRQTTPQ
jgi:hypothetical protein